MVLAVYVALLRGINVGGSGKLPMKDLAAVLESLGCREVRTYIQSGNAVFAHRDAAAAKLAAGLSAAIKKQHGFAPQMQILERKVFEQVVSGNPFPAAENDPQTLHVFFLDSKPVQATLKQLAELQSPTEQWKLRGTTFYLYAPDGIGRSKLAANVERKLGVAATSRNWRTVGKLLQMAEEIGR